MFRYEIIILIIQKWEKSTWEDCISYISYASHIPAFEKILYYSCYHLPLLHRWLLLTSPSKTWMAPLCCLFPSDEAELATELPNTSLPCSTTTVSDQRQIFLGVFLMAMIGKQEWEDRGQIFWHENEVYFRVLETEGQERGEQKQLVWEWKSLCCR